MADACEGGRVNTFRRICFGISPSRNPCRTGPRGKTARPTYRSKYTRAIHGPGPGVRFKHGCAHQRVPSSVMAPQTESVPAFASGGMILVGVPYEPTLVAQARTLPQRRWDRNARAWRLPDFSAAREAVLRVLGIEVEEWSCHAQRSVFGWGSSGKASPGWSCESLTRFSLVSRESWGIFESWVAARLEPAVRIRYRIKQRAHERTASIGSSLIGAPERERHDFR